MSSVKKKGLSVHYRTASHRDARSGKVTGGSAGLKGEYIHVKDNDDGRERKVRPSLVTPA